MNKYRVLVVDDSPLVLKLACAVLHESGQFECQAFSSAAELYQRNQFGDVDCVLADLRMPEVDGEELFQTLHHQAPWLSFVIMTGHADVKTAVRLMELGTFTLLEKPFTNDELTAVVLRAAERTRSLKQQIGSSQRNAQLLESLTADEQEVLDCMVAGLPNKVIAHRLALSPRTLDRRRQSILKKLGVDSVAEVAALVTRVMQKPS